MSAVKSVLRLLLVIGIFSVFIAGLTAMEESSVIKKDLLSQKVKEYIAQGCPHFDALKKLLDFSEKTEDSIYEKFILNANKSTYDDFFYRVMPLSYAVDVGDEKLVELLLLAGAHIDGMSEEIGISGYKSNDFPLDRAPIFHAIDHEKPKILEMLCKYGANVYRKHKHGGTPLHYVILHQIGYRFLREYTLSGEDNGNLNTSLAMIKILLKYGADVTLKARIGRSRYDHKPAVTPYELARKEGLSKICDCLSSHPRDNILSTLGDVWSDTLGGIKKTISEESPDELKIEELSISEEFENDEMWDDLDCNDQQGGSEFSACIKKHPKNIDEITWNVLAEASNLDLFTRLEFVGLSWFSFNINEIDFGQLGSLSSITREAKEKFTSFFSNARTEKEKKSLFLLKQYFFYSSGKDLNDSLMDGLLSALSNIHVNSFERNIISYFISEKHEENISHMFYFLRLAIDAKVPLLVEIILCAYLQYEYSHWKCENLPQRNDLLKTKEGKGILHEVVKAGNAQILMMLIMFFKNYTARNNNGQTPLQYAKKLGKKRIVQLLMLVEKHLGWEYK